MTASFAPQAHASTPQTLQGGSPEAEADREGGDEEVIESLSADGGDTDVEETNEEPSVSDAAPQTSAGEDPTVDEVSDLRSQLAEREALIGQIADEMDRNPELRAILSGQKGSASSEPTDWAIRLEKGLRGKLKPEAAEALTEVFAPFFKELQDANAEIGRLRSTAQSLSRTVGSREYVRALTDSGVTPETQNTQPFQKFLRGLRTNRTFQSLEARDPVFAAETVAARWQASRAQKSGWKDDRARLESAKNGRGAQGSQRSASLAEKVTEIVRKPDGSHVEEAQRIRLEYVKGGKELPKIRYIDR